MRVVREEAILNIENVRVSKLLMNQRGYALSFSRQMSISSQTMMCNVGRKADGNVVCLRRTTVLTIRKIKSLA